MMDKIQESRPEWRAFTSDDSKNISRTGTPSSLARHDMGLSTVTGRVDKDANGNRSDIQCIPQWTE
jgi:transcription initiation factor TFIIB